MKARPTARTRRPPSRLDAEARALRIGAKLRGHRVGRSQSVTARLTIEEAAMVRGAALAVGLRLGVWAREALLDAASQVVHQNARTENQHQ